jgi:hypothetical protein
LRSGEGVLARIAVIGGVVLGVAAGGWFIANGPGSTGDEDALPAANGAVEAHAHKSAWSRLAPLFATAPATTVTVVQRDSSQWPSLDVRVIDEAGRAVVGAHVVTRVSRQDYVIAGLSENEYDSTADAREAQVPEGANAVEAAILVTNESTTGDDGEVHTRIEPQVGTDFIVRDALGRTGIAVTSRVSPGAVLPPLEIVVHEVGSIEGRLTASDGAPIVGASLVLTSATGETSLPGAIIDAADDQVLSGSNGDFRIALREPGLVRLTVHRKGYQPVDEPYVQVLAGHATTLDLTMLEAGVLHGVVFGPPDAPFRASVAIHGARESNATASASANVDPVTGAFDVDGLAPGLYQVAASADGLYAEETAQTGGASVQLHLAAIVPEPIASPIEIASSIGNADSPEDSARTVDPGEPVAISTIVWPFSPDLQLGDASDGPVVLRATGDLLPGDRVAEVEGQFPATSSQALMDAQGPEGSTCAITVIRPATGQSFATGLPRIIAVSLQRERIIWEW